ncbi:hypothetical protein D3C81_1861590 [compost metagenome]
MLWRAPFCAVATCTKASCCSNCCLSRSENSALARRRIRLAPAIALAARLGSSTTLIWPAPKKLSSSGCIQAAKASAGMSAWLGGIRAPPSSASVVLRKNWAASSMLKCRFV